MRSIVLSLAASAISWVAALPAAAEPLGLRFGMSAEDVKATKPCQAAIEKASGLRCTDVSYGGTKMTADLTITTAGLARIGLFTSLGKPRGGAEKKANAIVATLNKVYGAVEWVGGTAGELKDLKPLFDNAEQSFTKFHGKMAGAAMFAVIKPPEKIHVSGKIIRTADQFMIELSFTKQ